MQGWANCDEQHERASKKIEFLNQQRKEVKPMQNQYEAPEFTVIGEANEVVMGTTTGGDDLPKFFGFDFEFEHD